jgi:site-specific DNA recombinase
VVQTFARRARERIRIHGGYRREHLRALAPRGEVADHKVRIGSISLHQTLTGAHGVKRRGPVFAVLF